MWAWGFGFWVLGTKGLKEFESQGRQIDELGGALHLLHHCRVVVAASTLLVADHSQQHQKSAVSAIVDTERFMVLS